MKEYKIDKNKIGKVIKKRLFKTIPLTLFASGLVVAYPFFTEDKSTDRGYLYGVIPILLVTLGVGFYLGILKLRTILESYVLTIDNYEIIREQFNTPINVMPLDDIEDIIRNKDGSFTIKSKKKFNDIDIPPQIEKYDELENVLKRIMPINIISKENPNKKYSALIAALILLSMMAVLILDNKIIVGISGALFTSYLAYAIFELFLGKNVDKDLNRKKYYLIFITILVAVITITKLMS